LAKERKIRRKSAAKKAAKLTSAQEQRKIEKLLGEEFDSLAQARRALKKESQPVKEEKPKGKSKSTSKRAPASPELKRRRRIADALANNDILNIPREHKHKLVQKLGHKEYMKRLRRWAHDHEEDLALQADNPYFYHGKG